MTRQNIGPPPEGCPADGLECSDAKLAGLAEAGLDLLRSIWRERYKADAPQALSKGLLARALAHDLQEQRFGGLEPRLRRLLDRSASFGAEADRQLKIGSVIVREHGGVLHEVMVVPGGFSWQGEVHASLSAIARRITGTNWNGHRFFGLRGSMPTKQIPETGKEVGSSKAVAPANDMSPRRPTLSGARRRKAAFTT